MVSNAAAYGERHFILDSLKAPVSVMISQISNLCVPSACSAQHNSQVLFCLTSFWRRTHRISRRKSSNEPAKQAERVLAPGDGEAEPGVTAGNFKEPAKLATDGGRHILLNKNPESTIFLHHASDAHFVGWVLVGFGSPGSASPSPGASTLFASFAGWLNVSSDRSLQSTT